MWEYIYLAVLSAILFGLGNVLQKKGLTQLTVLTVKGFFKNFISVVVNLLKNLYWLAGMITGVIAWFIYVEALSLGDLIVVKPIINLNLVVIIVLSLVFLKEKLRKHETFFISLIILGVILLSYDSRVTGVTVINEAFLIGLVVLLSLAIVVLNLFKFTGTRGEYAISLSAGLAYGIAEVFTKWLSIQGFSSTPFPDKILYFFMSPIFWSLALFTVFGFILKQTALSQGRACISIPLINALSIIIPVIISIIIFGEEIILLFSGVFLLPYSLFRIIGVIIIVVAVTVMNYITRKPCESL
ncbi:MAG: EamA family transporter [Candidatus Odinarchaeota archaeon]